jgi:hypothetical protein
VKENNKSNTQNKLAYLLVIFSCINKEVYHMPHKPGSSNPIQKGARRQNLNNKQNDVGNPKNKPEYQNFEGKPID